MRGRSSVASLSGEDVINPSARRWRKAARLIFGRNHRRCRNVLVLDVVSTVRPDIEGSWRAPSKGLKSV
jgi:hypothetical protein